ncbi:MAG: hypothetical protein L6R36_002579 [Xanthoria steineri]|nr:MAG: hypothetical protein L6R36_002579 [Xanthoria steineri]
MTDMQNGSQEKPPSTTEIPNHLPNTNGHPPSPVNADPDTSNPLDLHHAHSNRATFDHGPPSKRRKTADTATTDTPLAKSKPPSPPWKKFETEGPSTFEENGKRKSARTNRIPLDLQPPTDKRQTRAKLQKSTQLPKTKYSRASHYETKSAAASSPSNGKKLTGYGKSSAHAPPESSHKNGLGLRNGAKLAQPQLNLTPVKRAYRKRLPSTNGQSSINAPSDASPHQTRRTARTLDSSERGVKNGRKPTNGYLHTVELSERATDEDDSDGDGDEDDEEVDSDSDVVMGNNYKPQRLNLRVKLPSLSVQHPDQVVRTRRFPSFRDWFEAEGSKDPDAPARKPHDHVQAEANFRRKILEEAQPGGLLSKEKSTVYAPEKQEEPPRQWAHYDHVIAHHHNFRLLLRKEHETHRKAAKALANEAAEFWRSRQPKTDEEIQQEREAQYRAVYRQVQKDLQNKWDMVKAEAERRRLKEWEEEQQMLGKEALNKVLEQSTQLLDKRRRRSSTSAASSDDDRSSEERDNSPASDEVSGESQDEANMSTQSESDDGSADNDIDHDENLTREELIRKYARVKSPAVTRSPVLAKSETHIHDPGGAEAPTHPITDDIAMTPTSVVLSPQPVRSPADVDTVDDVLMDDSEDSTDMEDDMGDSDGDRSSESEKSDCESDASEGNTGLLGFITKKELLAAQEQREISPTQPQKEDEAPPIPDAAQVQTPSASNSEEPATETLETLETVDPRETSEQSPLHHMMNVDSVDHGHDHSLPTTPVSTKPLRTPVPSLLRGTLREYQHFGLDWLAGLYANGTNGILADEMGLGKTIQTISLLAHLAVEHENWGPHLIVVPTSVMLNWEMEFKKFLPGFKVLTYYGTQEERKQKRQGWISNSDKWNVWITSYQLALKDDQVFKRREWQFMVLDEAHNIKNFRSKRWQTLLTFNTRARLLLTGTPLQNNLTELWSLLFFLMPADSASTGIGGFADLQEFSNWFRKPVEQILEHGRDTMDDEAKAIVTKLHKVLRPYLLRRLKADVEKQMPGKYEHVVYCRLSKRQRYLYDGFMSRAQTRETLASGNYLSIINCLMQLRKVCNHPDLFETRQIVTSFAMPKSAVADFEIKELLVRRRLLHEQPMARVDLNVINLLPGSNEQFSALDTIQKQRLGALGILRQLTSQQWARIDQSMTFDGRTVENTLNHMENAARQARFEELRHASYLTSLRSQRRPLYSNSLIDRLTLGSSRLPMGRRPPRRVDLSNWWTESSSALAAMVPTLPERSYAMQTTIQKFACITPAVAAADMAPIVLSRKGVEVVRNVQRVYPEDPLHEARMRLSIAFPDKRLLQYDCGKLQRLDSLLGKLQSGGHRALIFTQMTKVLDILEQFLNIHGHRYLRLDGQTKIEQRQILTERFNNDPRILVFILSSRSGGLGINLTGADSVIFYDLDWNPAMDKQCQDRCHRIGQTRDVHIYRFVSEHTIEANILRKANQKRMLDDVVIQEGEFTTDYFNKVGPKDAFEEEGYSGDAEADAAMDRVLGGRISGKVFEQAEDREDIVAARNAEKELVQSDAADFEEKMVPLNGEGATPKTSGPATPGELMPPPSRISKRVEGTRTLDAAQSGLGTSAAGLAAGGEEEEEEEEEEEGASVEEYMLRLVQWEVQAVPMQPVGDRGKKKSKKGGEHGIRKR